MNHSQLNETPNEPDSASDIVNVGNCLDLMPPVASSTPNEVSQAIPSGHRVEPDATTDNSYNQFEEGLMNGNRPRQMYDDLNTTVIDMTTIEDNEVFHIDYDTGSFLIRLGDDTNTSILLRTGRSASRLGAQTPVRSHNISSGKNEFNDDQWRVEFS